MNNNTTYHQRYLSICTLVFNLSWNNFINRYRNSYMGLLWTVAYPLTNAAVLWFIFTQAFKVQPPKGDVPFIVWLLAGMAAWNFFADALVCVTGCITGNAYILKKRSFNLVLFPIVHVLSSFFSHCIFLGIAMGICLLYGILPSMHWLQLIYYFTYIFVLCLGMGFFTAAVTVFVPDVQNLINIFVQVFFWATPVFWSLSMLPERYAFFLALNPAAYVVDGYRDALLSQDVFWHAPERALLCWAFALLLLLVSCKFFHKMKQHFADVL